MKYDLTWLSHYLFPTRIGVVYPLSDSARKISDVPLSIYLRIDGNCFVSANGTRFSKSNGVCVTYCQRNNWQLDIFSVFPVCSLEYRPYKRVNSFSNIDLRPVSIRLICPECKSSFLPIRKNQVFCCPEHRKEFERKSHIKQRKIDKSCIDSLCCPPKLSEDIKKVSSMSVDELLKNYGDIE